MLDVREQLGVEISGQDDLDIKAGANHSVYVVFNHPNVRAAIILMLTNSYLLQRL